MSDCIDHGKTRHLKGAGYAFTWYEGKDCLLHRVVYAKSKGIPLQSIRGLVIRHTCDNPRCINPEHLLLGTQAQNNKDRAEQGRSAKVRRDLVKVSKDMVTRIKAAYVPYKTTRAQLAIEFSVSKATIDKILRGAYDV